ncbi:daptide-type RiPP biosynthesis methyltransferase [Streptomyces cacaoi]|uniref:daptide-type RiPP biosynthesis methyltransferase n=1 Tax=Streptomyces cacaoi TaxID=1898 RepID=UPI0037489EA6
MTETAVALPGSAGRIEALFGAGTKQENIYGPAGSQIYDHFTRNDRAEIDDMLRVAAPHPGPVLELACGNGRTTIPFLEAGYSVVGLDSSPDMLARMRDRLAELDEPGLADGLETVEGDMSAFSLGRRFGIILLGMTTVWNLDEEHRAGLFAGVREHLADDGRFLLTLLEFPGLEEGTAPFETVAVTDAHDGVSPVAVTFIEHVDPGERRRLTSFISHRVADEAVTGTTIYTAWTHLISPAALEKEIERAGLRVRATHEVTQRNQLMKRNTNIGRRRILIEVSH